MIRDLWAVLRGKQTSNEESLKLAYENVYRRNEELTIQIAYSNKAIEVLERENARLMRQINILSEVHFAALGRIIAKLDPLYGESEEIDLNPTRKAKSDAIGEAIIDKLKAEAEARFHTEFKR